MSCTQSHQATCPAWSTPSPTRLTCAATTASEWSGAIPSTSSFWNLSKSMTTSKYTAPMTSYRYSHLTPRETLPSPSHPHLALFIPNACWLVWPIGTRMTNITHGLGKLPHNWKWVLWTPFPFQLKTYTKQDSHHHQHHHLGPVGKYLQWRDDPHSSLTRSMPVGGTSVNSVGSKSLLPLIPAAMPWICCSSQTTQGTAGAGSYTTPLKVRLPEGLPHWPAMGQDQVGRKGERRQVALKQMYPPVSPTVIKCPQPKTLDEFTIIQDLQPQYQFRDYFIVTCKQGYQLVEVRAQG